MLSLGRLGHWLRGLAWRMLETLWHDGTKLEICLDVAVLNVFCVSGPIGIQTQTISRRKLICSIMVLGIQCRLQGSRQKIYIINIYLRLRRLSPPVVPPVSAGPCFSRHEGQNQCFGSGS